MTLPTFATLLNQYIQRSGISDAELARAIGVGRMTVFRWKEGTVARPRLREDVLRLAQKLRLAPEERDLLLLVAGFAPEAGLPQATMLPPLAPETIQPAAAENEELEEDEAPPSTKPGTVDPTLGETPAPSPQIVPPIFVPPPAPLETLPPSANRPTRRWLSPPIAGLVLTLLLVVGVVGFGPLRGALSKLMEPPAQPTTRSFAALQPTQAGIIIYKAPKALPGQTLILIAQFTGLSREQFNVANRLHESLSTQIGAAGLLSTTVTVLAGTVKNEQGAADLLAASGARIIIWGEYDDGRVVANLRVGLTNGAGEGKTEKIEKLLNAADDLRTIINAAVPAEMRILALMTLGRLYRNEANYAQAGAAFQQAINLEPTESKTRAVLYFYLGTVQEQAGGTAGYSRAIQAYSQALEQNPRLYNASYNRGTAYLNRSYGWSAGDERIQNDLTAAIADLTSMVTAYPRYRQAWLNRGIAHYERHIQVAGVDDLAQALKDVEQAIRLDDKAVDGYFHRGLLGLRAGGQGDWAGDFAKVLTLNPTYDSAQNALCWGHGLAQQPELALPFCEAAVASADPSIATVSLDSRALVYAQLERYPAAISDYAAYLVHLKTLPPEQYTRQRGPLIEQWIALLKQGKNPFDAVTLAGLR